jgi:hypothetical protein
LRHARAGDVQKLGLLGALSRSAVGQSLREWRGGRDDFEKYDLAGLSKSIAALDGIKAALISLAVLALGQAEC